MLHRPSILVNVMRTMLLTVIVVKRKIVTNLQVNPDIQINIPDIAEKDNATKSYQSRCLYCLPWRARPGSVVEVLPTCPPPKVPTVLLRGTKGAGR